jgi:hypothetical protein
MNVNATHINIDATHMNANATHTNIDATHINVNATHINVNATHINVNATHINADTTNTAKVQIGNININIIIQIACKIMVYKVASDFTIWPTEIPCQSFRSPKTHGI